MGPRRKDSVVMLQAIYMKTGVPQASSLYCQWIGVERPEATCLVAVWIDPQMRAFEVECAISCDAEGSGEELVPERGEP
jgi:hypothetical protein